MSGRWGRRIGRGAAAVGASLAVAALLAGCVQSQEGPDLATATPSVQASAPPSPATQNATPTPTPTGESAADAARHWAIVGQPTVLATGLAAPWSIAQLGGGDVLISERDSGRVLERTSTGSRRTAGTVPGVVHQGEAGLLGLAVRPGHTDELYAYLTTDHDNRVVRMPITGGPGARALGAPTTVIDGLPHNVIHNGGRIAFGPDGMLYVTVGDANDRPAAQDTGYLGGKILRLEPDGGIPTDNPFPGSPVWTYGHRNPQGIGWAPDGTLWASEFGQDTWDELNVIRRGQDYGWPIVEGIGHKDGYVDPVAQWSTDDASPSGIAVVDSTVFIAGLGGRRLWIADVQASGDVTTHAEFSGTYGRIRDVERVGADTLWILTNNTDGRGTPQPGDDKLLEVHITPAD